MTIYVCNECQAEFISYALLALHWIATGHQGMTVAERKEESSP